MKKKSSTKKFKTSREMDAYLATADLAGEFAARGVVKKAQLRKINLDLPDATVQQIDRIAERVGVSRQPLLKIWIHERLKVEGMH